MQNLNKHIHFDDDQDSQSSSSSVIEIDPGHEKIQPNKSRTLLELKLIKQATDRSYGFQVSGQLEKGQHYVDSIVHGSPAHQAGLYDHDKIISINKLNVEHLNVEQLIKQLERETKKNDSKLNLTVARKTNNDPKRYTKNKSTNSNNDNVEMTSLNATTSVSAAQQQPKQQSFKHNNQNLSQTYTNLKRRIMCKL